MSRTCCPASHYQLQQNERKLLINDGSYYTEIVLNFSFTASSRKTLVRPGGSVKIIRSSRKIGDLLCQPNNKTLHIYRHGKRIRRFVAAELTLIPTFFCVLCRMRLRIDGMMVVCFSTTNALSGSAIPRRGFLISAASQIMASPVLAFETIGKDPNCNDRSCMGVWDGLLADCPHNVEAKLGGALCASSQDDTPGIFAEPWDFGDFDNLDYDDQMKRLVVSIQLVSAKRGDTVDILQREGRYLRARFRDAKTSEVSVGEFYFTPNDTTVQFRVASVNGSALFSLRNLERCEMIRKQLGFQKLPVLRNRKQAFFFGESDFDTFGPGSATLGPPADMRTGDLDGRQEDDPKIKIDLLQLFPKIPAL